MVNECILKKKGRAKCALLTGETKIETRSTTIRGCGYTEFKSIIL